MSLNRVPLLDRLMTKVEKTATGCWEFTGTKCKWGYGRIRVSKAEGLITTHRAMYQEKIGPIPDNMCVCHSCDNPACVNPKHLWLGTNQDNRTDCVNKGRAKGALNNTNAARYSNKQIHEIRQLRNKGLSVYKIQDKTGVPKSTVHRIITGQQYQEVA
jgi:hypothetical protein